MATDVEAKPVAEAVEPKWVTRAKTGEISQPAAFLDEKRAEEKAKDAVAQDDSALNATQRFLDNARKDRIEKDKEAVGFGGKR